jgi:hypothetical protein
MQLYCVFLLVIFPLLLPPFVFISIMRCSYVGSIDGYLYAVYTTGDLAGQQQWKYYVGGGLTITGILSTDGSELYGGNEVDPGSSIYAIQLPSGPSPVPPATTPAPTAPSSSNDVAAALRDMRIAFILWFLLTWLANVCGVCYYCRSSSIAVWPAPIITAVFLHVSHWHAARSTSCQPLLLQLFLCWIYMLCDFCITPAVPFHYHQFLCWIYILRWHLPYTVRYFMLTLMHTAGFMWVAAPPKA